MLGADSIKKVLRNHGVQEPFFGVKIGDMKKIQKRIKKDYQLALDLYDTGNYDAMYLAGLVADDAKMTKNDLNRWVKMAKGGALASATVPWVAAGSDHGYEIALEWIESQNENVAVAGWATLSSLVAMKDDDELDPAGLLRLLHRVQETIHQHPDSVRSAMNGFLIALGTYVQGLSDLAVQAAAKVGPVSVDMGNTACEVPNAVERIQKAREKGEVGKKRKTVKC
jgi:3-methyladenine DNA glycosylase AlkD